MAKNIVVYTLRSGTTVHASPSCPTLARGGRILRTCLADVFAHSERCTHSLCVRAFARA